MLTYVIAVILIAVCLVAFAAFMVAAFDALLSLLAFLFRLLSIPFDVHAFFRRRKKDYNAFEDAFK